MEKPLFEQMGGTIYKSWRLLFAYTHFTNRKRKHIGVWGQRHAKYLKTNPKVLYTNLLTYDRLNKYLASVDALAMNMFFRLVTEYAVR